jgi:hypothetical protein
LRRAENSAFLPSQQRQAQAFCTRSRDEVAPRADAGDELPTNPWSTMTQDGGRFLG